MAAKSGIKKRWKTFLLDVRESLIKLAFSYKMGRKMTKMVSVNYFVVDCCHSFDFCWPLSLLHILEGNFKDILPSDGASFK